MRRTTSLIAALVVAAACLGASAPQPSAVAANSSATGDDAQEFAQIYLELDVAISAVDVSEIELDPALIFAGVRYSNGPLVGENYYGDPTSVVWSEDFEAIYGSPPRITHIIVMEPVDEDSEPSTPGPSEATPTASQAQPTTEGDLAASVIPAPTDATTPVDEIDVASPGMTQYSESSAQAELAAGSVPVDDAAAAAIYWSPSYTEYGVRPVTLPSGTQRAGFYSYFSWDGAHTPAALDPNFAVEYEVNIYDLTGPWSGSRPACSVLPVPFIPVPDYKDQFWAVNYNWDWQAISNTGDPYYTIPYADINDQSDSCDRNSITIGLVHPQNLWDGSGYSDLVTIINAPFGVESTSGVGALLQSAENATCAALAVTQGYYVATDCIGLNGSIGRNGSDNQPSYVTLNTDRGDTVPSLCWRTTAGTGNPVFANYFDCSLLGGG